MNDYRRARLPEQKEERRLALLRTAGDYLREGGDVRELGLNELARLASMTKSNVCRYFESREAVLLALLTTEWSEWTLDFVERAQMESTKPLPLCRLVELVAATVSSHPVLGQLTAILPSVLEHNLSEEALLEFKRSSLEFFRKLASLFHSLSPELTEDNYMGWTVDLVMVIAGLYPFAHPSKAVERAHASLGPSALRHDYEADLRRMAQALADARRSTRSPSSSS
jgi:AcrR family transcriptional regulator